MHGRKPLCKMEQGLQNKECILRQSFFAVGSLLNSLHTGQKTVFRQAYKN